MNEAESRAYAKGRVEELRLAADSITEPRWFLRLYSMSRKAIAKDLRDRADEIEENAGLPRGHFVCHEHGKIHIPDEQAWYC